MKKHKIPKSIQSAIAEGKRRRKNYKIFDILTDENLNKRALKATVEFSNGFFYAPYIPVTAATLTVVPQQTAGCTTSQLVYPLSA